MATNANTTADAATPAADPKAKTVLDDMDSRRILPNPEQAVAYLSALSDSLSDFGNYPVAAAGVTMGEDGLEFDPEIYSDSTEVMIAVLTQRGDGPGTSSVKAIVIAPVPTIDSVLADKAGREWLTGIMQKELNHVAVRQLRKAEDVGDVVDSMPKTLADYITSNRESGGILAAYEELWRPIKNSMAKLSRSFKLANLSKKEFRRGLESSAYAGEYYPTLEETKQGSLFVFALKGFIAQAEKQGLDPTIFQRWLENRDEKQIDVNDDEDEEFSLDDLTAALAPEKKEEAPAADSTDTPPADATGDGTTDEDTDTATSGDESETPPAE